VTADEPESKGALSSRMGVSESLLVGAAGLGAVASSFAVAPGRIGVCGAVLGALMLAIAVIDRRRQIIPDPLNGLAFVGGLITAILNAEVSPAVAALDALMRAAVMFSLFFVFRAAYRKMRRIDGMGFGDVKLAAVAGCCRNCCVRRFGRRPVRPPPRRPLRSDSKAAFRDLLWSRDLDMLGVRHVARRLGLRPSDELDPSSRDRLSSAR